VPLSVLQQFLFLKQKCRSLFLQRKRPAKLAWTVLYRKQHRKVCTAACTAMAAAVLHESADAAGVSRPVQPGRLASSSGWSVEAGSSSP
jgi:hypothetical protein